MWLFKVGQGQLCISSICQPNVVKWNLCIKTYPKPPRKNATRLHENGCRFIHPHRHPAYRTGTAHDGREKVWLNGKLLNLDESLKHCSKSPTGFNWGYNGSGPAQLAHEICRQLYGLDIAKKVFQGFKHRHIADIQADTFDLTIDLGDFNRAYVRPFVMEKDS